MHFEAAQPESPMNGARTLSVCHLTSGDGWGGLEAQVATLLRHFATDPALQVSAILLSEGRLADELRQCGIEVNVVAQPRSGYFGALVKAAEILRRKPVHILHSHRYNENLMAVALKRWCKVPHLVRTQHGRPEPYAVLASLRHALVLQADHIVSGCAFDRVICVSSELLAHVRCRDRSQLVIVHNGVDMDEARSALTPEQAKLRLGIANNVLVVGSLGRLERIKRIDLFLLAAKYVVAALPDTRFLVIGGGRQRSALEKLAEELHLGESVRFLAHRDDTYDLLRALDLMLLTSDHEGLPIALLEAMALGVPVVARGVGGVPEVIEDGVNGITVSSSDPVAIANHVISVLNNPPLRIRLALEARRLVAQQYSAATTAAETARLYLALHRTVPPVGRLEAANLHV